MGFIKKAAGKIFRFATKSQYISKFIVRNLKLNDELTDILIKNNQEVFIKSLFQYPSAINNGYRHIERAIGFVKYFKLPPGNAILDIGAAEGVISMMFSEAFPSAEVYAFEPIKLTYNNLKNNTSSNPKIIAVNTALGNTKEEIKIHVAERITSSSIFEIEKNIKNEYFAENLTYKTNETIKITRLDDFIGPTIHINLVKIDVQGFELEVLKGGVEVMKRTAIILLEMQNHDLYNNAPKYYELDEYLRSNNFELFDVIPSIRQDNMLYEWDGIYVNKKIIR